MPAVLINPKPSISQSRVGEKQRLKEVISAKDCDLGSARISEEQVCKSKISIV